MHDPDNLFTSHDDAFVYVTVPHFDDDATERLTPDEARLLALRLIRLADKVDAI